jgi:hypothetical protein
MTLRAAPETSGVHAMYGRTRWLRSSSVRPDEMTPCIEPQCRDTGDGTHVFAYAFDAEPGSLVDGRPEHQRDVAFWLYLARRQFPDGTRLRITVEAVADEAADGPAVAGD